MKGIRFNLKVFIVGALLLASLCYPAKNFAQTSSNFTIAQVVINACLGYIEVSVQYDPGDAANISYQWFEKDTSGNYILIPNETTRILYASPGEYRIEVTNSRLNQTITGDYVLSSAFPLQATDLFSGLICSEIANSGAILAYMDNGSSPYQYTLTDSNGSTVAQGNTSQGQETILVENLAAGTYTLNWEDSLGCTGTLSIDVDIPAQLNATHSTTSPLCFGGTGGMSFSVNGGWGADYKVQLLDPQGTPVVLSGYTAITTNDGIYYDIGNGQNIAVSGLLAGIYELKFYDEPLNARYINRYSFDVTNTTACIRSESIEITQPDELLVESQNAIVTNSTCFGADDGSIQITPTGGTSPYSFSWSASNGGVVSAGQVNSNTLTNLPPGTYTLTLTDDNSCQFTDSYTITQPDQLTIGLNTFTNISCNGGSDGELVVQVDGGTPTYSFTVNGVTTNPTSSSGNLYTFSGLAAGNYTITVTDANNCAVSPASVSQALTEPAPLSHTINDFALACFGDTNGVIDGTISGGTAPYSIRNNQTNQTVVVTTDGGTFSFIGLLAGNYTFTITDANSSTGDAGCTTTATANVTQPTRLSASANTTNSTCFGADDGSIQITPTGGTSPYSFSWSASNGGVVSAGQVNSNTLTNLPPGTYTLTLTDDNSCQFTDSYTITQPDQLTIGLNTFTNISCNGGSDGELVVQVDGGTPTYSFTVNGVTTNPTSSSGNLYTFSGLAAGNYTITVTDANNCAVSPASVSQALTEPAPLSHTINDFALACFGDTNGVIDGTISGGTAPYSIRNNQTNQTVVVTTDGGTFSFIGLLAGNYTFTITDANSSTGDAGCTTTATANVTQPTAINVSESITNITCFGDDDGAIQLTTTGGTAPYSYAWSTTNGSITPGEETTNSLTNLPQGTYTLTLTDDNSCQFTNTYTITEPAPIGVNSNVSTFDSGSGTTINISCNGASDGFINITPTGGTAPFTYQWTASNGGSVAGQTNAQNLSGLMAGTYSLLITDANNCSTTESIDLIQPRILSGSATVTQDNVCYDGTLGVIETTIDNTGSVDGISYTYTISGANLPTGYTSSETTTALSQRFQNLPAGTFTITVTDANGCAFTTAQQTIAQPSSPITISETISDFNGFNISCFGQTDASITLSVTGGTPATGGAPYTYQWTSPSGATIPAGQENTNSLSGIGSGTYEVTVADGTGVCLVTQSYTITEPTAISLSGTTSDYNGFGVSAFNAADGSIDLTVTGGIDTKIYTYSWTTSNGTIPNGQEILEDPSGLTEGTYTVIVTDDNNCSETASFTLTEPLELLISEVTASHQNVDCFGDSTGVIEISIDQESVPPYDYVLSLSGTTVQSINTNATNHTFSNLAAGAYDVTVTDANGISKTLNSIVISQPASAFTGVVSTSSFTGPNGTFQISCFGSAEGAIDITLSGGTPFDQGLPSAYYNYELTNSAGTVVSNGQGTTISFTNLVADTYTFAAQDATGNCTVNETITISQPNELIITTDLFQDMQCFGANDGIVNVTLSGGLGNYSYNWTKDGSPFSTQEDISGLEEGTYVLMVEDLGTNSCTISQTYTITEPAELFVSLNSKTDVLCFGDATGAIDINVAGGIAPYQFAWTHSSGTSYTTEDLINVPAGVYNLTVTDNNNCAKSLQVELTQPSEILFNATTTAISCYGYNDGSITINPTGGIPPYSISWSDLGNGTTRTNLSPGVYTATIVDAIGCVVSEDIEVIDAPIFSLQGSTATNISCFGANDGSISLTITGGVAPLKLTWSDDPSAGIQRNNLSSGIYNVEVISADNCIQNASFVINEPQELSVSAVVVDAIDCTDPNSGSIDVTVVGGTLPYSFAWNNGATTEDLIAIPANNYSVTITDANGCSVSGAYQVIRQDPLTATISTNIQADCDTKEVIQENEAIVSGGFPPYTISWSYGDVDSTNPAIMRTNVGGVAIVTITDNNGCTITQNVTNDIKTLGDPDFTMDSAFHTDYSIWAIDDPITFTNTSSGDAQSFLWDFGDGSTSTDENPTHTYAKEGTYQITLTVTYSYGCSYSVSYTIVVGKGYEIEIPNGFTPNGDGVNDVFRPVYLGMKEVKLSIYDTWGGLLYAETSTSNTFNGWNGTVDGKPLENGNYIFQIEAISRNDIEIQKTGPFALIK